MIEKHFIQETIYKLEKMLMQEVDLKSTLNSKHLKNI